MSEPPHNIGRYEVMGEIGRGGMGVVYRSRHFELERIDALKALHVVADSGPDIARRFLHEARVASGLSHPNVVTVYDYFEWGGTPYIAMEFLAHGSLRPYVSELTLPQIGGVLGDVLAGLAHAERRHVVHRDLKPENLLVTDEGRVKIADFGIAKATSQISAAAFRTATGMTVGTPGYMAPEQAMAQEVGPWTDLYSLGCMAYEMCVGQLPFADSNEPIALLLRHLNEPIEPAHSANPDVNPDLSRWIDGLLVKEPERRTSSPTVAWETLEELLISTIGPRWRRSAALSDAAPSARQGASPETSGISRSSILVGQELVDQLSREGRTDGPAEPAAHPAAHSDDVASPPAGEPAVTVAPRGGEATDPGTGLSRSGARPGRTRRAWLVAGCALAVLIVAGVVLALMPHGGPDPRDGGQGAGVARGVRELATILDFSAAGNHLSKRGELSAAVQNRTEVASRLAAFHPPQALRAAAATLTEVTRLAIQFNRQRLSGRDESARKADRQANVLRHRFLEQFNPLAQRYLGRSYRIGQF